IEQVEAATPGSLAEMSRLAGLVELSLRGTGKINDRQGIQVTQVAGTSNLVIVVEVANTFVHGQPGHLLASLAHARAADTKLTRLVDHRLDAEDQTELVVHLQPVVFHAVFDAGTGPAFFLAVGEHFAQEAWIELAAEESEHVRGRELQGGVIEETRIQRGQGLPAAKENVGAELGLVDDPVIV